MSYRDGPHVRPTRLVGFAGLVLIAAVLVTVSAAQATIVIGQSIAGVKLGDSTAQVKQILGKPTKNELGSFFYSGLRINIEHGKVAGILSFSKKQKTSKGITFGSSQTQLKRAYPQAKCEAGPYGPRSLFCAVVARLHGKESFTGFLFQTAATGVGEIELAYGNGKS